MIRLPEMKTAELSTYGNFAKCHQALFRVPCEGLATDCLRHTPKMAVVEPIWQLYTLIVMNS